MEWTIENTDKTKWHVWYAWYPICIEYENAKMWVWFDHVERKKSNSWSNSYNHRPVTKEAA